MRSKVWKRLIPAAALLAVGLAFVLPGGAQAAATSAAATAPATAGFCGTSNFTLTNNGHNGYVGSGGILHFDTSAGPSSFCQILANTGTNNVEISHGSGTCLAYNASTGQIYQHGSPCNSSLDYEQWHFIAYGSGVYLIESAYKINGGFYCINASDPLASMAPCDTTGRHLQELLHYATT
jgi:hypothetical protein